ncbi:MAG: exonuclease [Bacillota bacterium]|jgi:ribonuclease J|nr:exonuclease [Thermoanaerobacteraceae bacterium]
MSVALTFLDGVNCIGGNKILLEAGGAALLFDFGTNFGAEGAYFDEFLRPRSFYGLGDLLELGLLPPLPGIYRRDLELPGEGWWEKFRGHSHLRAADVQGVLLSHAHVDHCGYIAYLEHDLPVCTSLSSAVIVKAIQDTGKAELAREVCYTAPRQAGEGGLLEAERSRRVPARQRQFVAVDVSAVPEQAAAFWEDSPATRGVEPRPIQAAAGSARIGGLEVRFWPVDHSIPGAGAFAVRTSAGWVVYTGDLRLHGGQAGLTERFIREAAALKPLALLCEGTRPETARPVTEEEVRANACEEVRRAEGLVVADFGPRNVERLLAFLEAARNAGRRLAVLPKDAYLLEALSLTGLDAPDPLAEESMVLYVEAKLRRDRWEKELIERWRERAPEKVIRARNVTRAPGAYVLCFSYYDLNELIDIGVYGGKYIYSSCEPFNEEMRIDFNRLLSWVRHFGLEFLGGEGSRFHASGHIHGPGIEELVETVRPEVLIPVHSESRSFFQRFHGVCKVICPEKGEKVTVG